MICGNRIPDAMRLGILILALSSICQTRARAASAIDTLAAQMSQAADNARDEEGLAIAQKLEGLVRRQQGTNNMNYAGVLHNEGMFLHNLGRYQEAVEKLNAALAMLDRRAEASVVAERALAIGTQAFGPDDVRLTGALAALGGLARDQENYKDAESYFERSLEARQKSPQASPFEVASSMDDLGDLYGLEGRFDDGERLLKQGLKLIEQTYGTDVRTTAPNYDKIL